MQALRETQPEVLDWLLETESPGVRYLVLRDLLNEGDSHKLAEACRIAHTHGSIHDILQQMDSAGYWVKPGAGYGPKYKGTVWAIITLAQLGASVQEDERIAQACNYLLDHALTENGQFTISGTPSSTVDCLQGNLCSAMLDLGYNDPRLEKAFEWMARSVTGAGIAPQSDRQATLRYYAGKCGPLFVCGANNKLPCAWGAVKVMLAFSKLPGEQHTPEIDHAIQDGIDFLFSTDPALADYPSGYSSKPSGNWWKFGFPVFYVTDLLQLLEALVNLGYGNDPRLENALNLVRDKRDAQGRWRLEYSYAGKIWNSFGAKNQPNKWVTLRALRIFNAVTA